MLEQRREFNRQRRFRKPLIKVQAFLSIKERVKITMENNHQEKLNQIEAECNEIKRQILQLEFQNKKDMTEHKKYMAEHEKEMAEYKKESVLRNRQIERHLSHLSKLAGITFEELDAIDDDLQAAAVPLSRSRKR